MIVRTDALCESGHILSYSVGVDVLGHAVRLDYMDPHGS